MKGGTSTSSSEIPPSSPPPPTRTVAPLVWGTLAAASGSPTIVLFSNASDPDLSAPRGHVAVLRAPDLSDLPVSQVLQAADALTPSPVRA